MYDPLQFEHRLVETGGEVMTPMGDGGMGYGRDAEFCYLWEPDKVAVGFRSTFDRWANSRDFVLHRAVETVDLDTLRHACHLAADQGHHNGNWAQEFDLGAHYRKAKKR